MWGSPFMMTCRLILCMHVVMLGIAIHTAEAGVNTRWRNKARNLYKEGMAFRRTGQPEAARQCFAAAIRSDSNFTAAYSALGDVYFELRSYEEALQYCRKAQQLGAEKMNRQIGLSWYHLQQYENALEALQQAGKEEPANNMVPYHLAQIHAQLGNYRESIHYYKDDLVIDSTHTNAWYELGMMFFNIADFPAAVASFEKAVALGCKEEGLSYNLAHAMYNTGNFSAAIVQWENVLRLQPANAFVMFMLGKSYMGNGDTAKGTALCDKALALDTSKTTTK